MRKWCVKPSTTSATHHKTHIDRWMCDVYVALMQKNKTTTTRNFSSTIRWDTANPNYPLDICFCASQMWEHIGGPRQQRPEHTHTHTNWYQTKLPYPQCGRQVLRGRTQLTIQYIYIKSRLHSVCSNLCVQPTPIFRWRYLVSIQSVHWTQCPEDIVCIHLAH